MLPTIFRMKSQLLNIKLGLYFYIVWSLLAYYFILYHSGLTSVLEISLPSYWTTEMLNLLLPQGLWTYLPSSSKFFSFKFAHGWLTHLSNVRSSVTFLEADISYPPGHYQLYHLFIFFITLTIRNYFIFSP